MNINKKYFFVALLFSLVGIASISIILGPVKISLIQIFNISSDSLGISSYFEEGSYSKIHHAVFLGIRLPRLLMAIIVGMALGTSGAILQGLFRNPLVDPGFIGVSSGAAVGAMLVIMYSDFFLNYINAFWLQYLLPVFAMLGAIITTILVFKISKTDHKTNVLTMLLVGIAINALVGSLIGFLVVKSSDAQLRSFTFWTMGGLDGANWEVVGIASLFIIIPLFFAYSLRAKLDIFMLGDSEARHLGLGVEKLKRSIIIISALMVGASVSFCGMIGFVGLVTPHLVRLFIGPSHKYLLIGSTILGALLLASSDFLSRAIIAPAQLPISIITSLIGAPFFIWLIIEQKRRMQIV